MIASLVVMAALAALVALYAQAHVPDFTAGTAKAMLTRTLLAGVGLALGFVAASAYPTDRLAGLLSFIIGFGIVHVPAAVILFIKGQRRAGRS
jgi:hypothetical protein